ncbi:phage neck terminator protein [Shouchella lehensis]|uniref:Phage neck terminator protein gp12-like domain-containing protein n=1 Tax=Shouchella lehensis TaxID=300825 RepID=A0A4Y7WDY6_9BACI|nr:hypothetical protein [Shouchella lehensis]MBG9783585.1 hypothetical protein [Shouchella lehensis]TES45658.1 hypothetical protein E2L03_19950 [Shouchella lehensis]
MEHIDIINAIIKLIYKRTGLFVVPSGTVGDKPDYPYVSYTITSPYLAVHRGVEHEGMFSEQWECVVSLLFHVKNDALEAMGLSKAIAQYFKTQPAQQFLREHGIVWVSNDGFGNRDTFLTVSMERRHGFDVKLRTYETIQHTTASDFETIENIET